MKANNSRFVLSLLAVLSLAVISPNAEATLQTQTVSASVSVTVLPAKTTQLLNQLELSDKVSLRQTTQIIATMDKAYAFSQQANDRLTMYDRL